MCWRILAVLLVCLLLAADDPKGDSAKGAADKQYAKVELKGELRSRLPLGSTPPVPILEVHSQDYELDLSKLKAPIKKEIFERLEGTVVVIKGNLILPSRAGTGGKLPKMPLVVVTRLIIVYE